MDSVVTIRVPRQVKRELHSISRAEHVPVSELIRASLQRTIALHRFRGLRRKALRYAQAEGFLTDEDVFNEVS